MNIGFIVDHWGRGGGSSGQCQLAARGLASRGHQVVVYAPTSSGPDSSGVQVVVTPPRRGRGPRAWRGAQALAEAGGHDVVMSWVRAPGNPVWRAGGATHAAWLQVRDGGRSWRDRAVGRDRRELSADRACQEAPVVVANSRLGVEALVADGVDRERIHLVRNGVDLDLFVARGRAARAGRVAVFVGHGFRRKGLDVAVQAFERVAGVDDRLWVAGRDAHEARWRRRVTARLGHRVRWIGPVANVHELLADADALLHPTRFDSSANVVLEALAAGVPAVTTAADGASEIVPHPELVVQDPDDVGGVAAALGYAWEARGRRPWREAAEAWPGSRMAEGLETLLMEWLDARTR